MRRITAESKTSSPSVGPTADAKVGVCPSGIRDCASQRHPATEGEGSMNLALIIIIIIAIILAIFGGLNSALSWLLWVAIIVGVIALIVFLFRLIRGNRTP
jgi:Flp pilus assembly protein TadB